jgi:hypothetical protein
MAEWEEFDLSDAIENSASAGATIGEILQALSSIVDSVSSVLEILKNFMVIEPDPQLAAVKAILNQVKQTINNLKNTGVYALFLTPDSLDDLAENYQGGYEEFEQLFVQSMFDVEDSERPQIGENGHLGGLTFFISARILPKLLDKIEKIAAVMGGSSIDPPPYPTPTNFRALPANDNGVPMERAFLDAFSGEEKPEGILLEWQEPRFADDVFLDVFSQSKFYIEVAKQIDGEGLLKDQVPTDRENPLERRQRKEGNTPNLGRSVQTPNGSERRVWRPLDESDPFIDSDDTSSENTRLNFLAGSYSHYLDDIEKGIENGKFYRISSVPLDVELEKEEGSYVLKRSGVIYEASPSSPIFGALPDINYDFDLPSALLNVYRAGYILRMDREVQLSDESRLTGSNFLERPLPKAVLEDLNGKYQSPREVIPYFNISMFNSIDSIMGFDESIRAVKGDLVVDPLKFDAFGGADEFVSPRESLEDNERFRIAVDRLAEQRVDKLVPIISNNDHLFQAFQDRYRAVESDIEAFLSSPVSLSGEFLNNSGIRQDIAYLLRIAEGNVEQGAPPNWEELNIVEDLFPDIKELFDLIEGELRSLESALQNSIDEITESVEGIRERLEKLTSIIDSIEDLIEFLKQIQLILDEVKMLWIPPKRGGSAGFVDQFTSAKDKPTTRDSDWFSGIVLAVGGQDPTGSWKGASQAIKTLFGV